MTQRRFCRIFTRALNAYQIKAYQNASRGAYNHCPKSYEGILAKETSTHVWLDGVQQYDGQTRTFAIPRGNITRREFPK